MYSSAASCPVWPDRWGLGLAVITVTSESSLFRDTGQAGEGNQIN